MTGAGALAPDKNSSMPQLSADTLQRVATEIFTRAGTPAEHALCVARHLVDANLTGHDSHGVLRIPQYVEMIDAGKLKPAGAPQIVHDAPASAVLDGGRGFGQVIARDAMLLAIRKARAGGVGAVTARHCSHTGRIGTYTVLAAEAGLVGIAMVNSGGGGQSVAPFGGIKRRLATNPLSIATPSGGSHPIMLDIASSVAPEGKMRNYFQSGRSVPPGWLIDAEGRPSTTPADFYAQPGGALQPLGGLVGHKGFAMAFVIDLLAGALSGAGCSSADPQEGGDGMLAIALDIEQFTPMADFIARVTTLAEYVKSCPTAPGFERIFVPGEPEALQRECRLRDGIVVPPLAWEQIERICQRFGVEVPA